MNDQCVKLLTIYRTDDPNFHEMLLSFKKRDGSLGRLLVPTMLGPIQVHEHLKAAIAVLPDDRKEAIAHIDDVIKGEPKLGFKQLASRVGWTSEDAYVLPHKTHALGKAPKPRHRDYVERTATDPALGTLEAWMVAIAPICQASSLAVFALGVALSGPILAFFRARTGIVLNLSGESGTGKSTAQRIAQSVWKSAEPEDIVALDITPAGMEKLAVQANDGFLALDDFGNAENAPGGVEAVLAALSYKMRDGRGRTRSKLGEQAMGHGTLVWRVSALTSSEQPVEVESGKRRRAGEIVRLIQISVPAEKDRGIIDSLGPNASLSLLFDNLEDGIRENHGVCSDRLLKRLVRSRSRYSKYCNQKRSAFIEKIQRDDRFSPVQKRYVEAFGTVCAALHLAVYLKLIPIDHELVERSVVTAYAASELQLPAKAKTIETLQNLQSHIANDNNCPLVPKGKLCSPNVWSFRRNDKGRRVVYLSPLGFEKFLGSKRSVNEFEIYMKAKDVLILGSRGSFHKQVQVSGLEEGTDRPRLIALDLEKLMACK